ncbi:MAG TPA: hypothetical protein VFA18_16870, partial [Gemmataceae bacterium]|nr:hypothetical protein [Gemmataceae bacterium]
ELATIKHGVTHHRITLVCLDGEHQSGEFRPGHYPQAEWLEPSQLLGYPVSSPQRRLIEVLNGQAQRRLF